MKKPLKKIGLTHSLTQTIQEYASRSSIHGISYAFDRELNVDVDDDDDDKDEDDNGYDDNPWDQLAIPLTGSSTSWIGSCGSLWWLPSRALLQACRGTCGHSGMMSR